MTEDIGAGVKILLERGKTNPDELREEYGKWANLREAVFEYKERKQRSAWLRGLTEHEIEQLFNMFNAAYRGVFDGWVMKTVLGAEEEDVIAQRVGAYQMAQGKRVMAQHKMAHSLAANNIAINNPGVFQNSIPPGSWQDVAAQTSNTSITTAFKNALGIK